MRRLIGFALLIAGVLSVTPAAEANGVTVGAFSVDRFGDLLIFPEGDGNPLVKQIVLSGTLTCSGGTEESGYTLHVFATQAGDEVGNTGGVGGPLIACDGDSTEWTATLVQTFTTAHGGKATLSIVLSPFESGGNLFETTETVILRPHRSRG